MKKFGFNKKFLFWSFVLVLFFSFVVLVGKVLLPQIVLNGGENIVINYNEKYKENGFKANFWGNDLTSKVLVEGKVNEKKLGEYEVDYKVKYGFIERKVVRHIYVKDIEKPKLSVTSDDLYVCPDSKIKKDKVTAIDNYDGDISSKVKVKVLKDKIIYSVQDSNGNKKIVTKKVIFKDIEKPNITLEGGEEITVYVGEEYKELGYSVSDNCDNNLKDKVKVEGSVDTSKEGVYTITYKLSDSSDNSTSVTRKVNVVDNKGIIYLTFDDGPNDGTTNVILDILKEEGVKATFFVTCHGPDELIKREYDEGHTVALHTATHNYAILYASDEAYFNDLQQVQNRVKRITGFDSKIIRFPGGASNTISRRYSSGIMSRITQEVLNRGYKYYDWNISSGDAGNTTDPNVVYSNVVNSLRTDRANMVLMHDIKTYTRDALRNIIRYGKNNGYRFERITMDTEMIAQRVNN